MTGSVLGGAFGVRDFVGFMATRIRYQRQSASRVADLIGGEDREGDPDATEGHQMSGRQRLADLSA